MPYKDKEKQKLYWRKYQQSDKRKAYKAEWHKNNPDKVAVYQERHVARRKKDPVKYRTYFRNRHLITKYGITQEWYDQTAEAQGGLCAICGSDPDITTHGITRFAIDHCHKTGKVRGLLCNNCNVGIGLFADNPGMMRKAAGYLEAHSKEA